MTHFSIHTRLTRTARDERGIALLIAVIVLLLMSALGLAALQHAGDEASGSGTSRRKDATLYAAESGLTMLRMKLLTKYWNSATMDPVTLDDTELPIEDGHGNGIQVRSGAPMAGTLPNPAQSVGPSTDGVPEHANGFEIRIGSQPSQFFRPVRADVTALDIANGMVHLQAQYRVQEPGGSSY